MAVTFATQDANGRPLAFRLVRGARWDDEFQLIEQSTGDPVDLTGITSMVMRCREDISGPIVMELSLANTRLTLLDPVNGRVGIRVGSATTRTFPENDNAKARYVADVVIERTPGEYEPGIALKVTVLPQITRPWSNT
jgi:hypothetical protein